MLLNSDVIRNIVKGAVRVDECGGYYRFYRFSQAQQNAYRNTGNADFFRKQFSSAGIKLAFYSDADRITFDYRLDDGSSRKFAYFDVLTDGVMVEHFGAEEISGVFCGHADIRLKQGKTEIFLPWSKSAEIGNITLHSATYIKPVEYTCKMVCYGDSITQGYDVRYPSLCYCTRLADFLGAECVNRGVGKECFFPELLDYSDEIVPDIVLTAYGTNDWSRLPRDVFTVKAVSFIKGLKRLYPQALKIVVTPLWRADGEKATPCGIPHYKIGGIIKSVCDAEGDIMVVDGYSLTPHIPDFYSDLYLHPNDKCSIIMAEAIYKAVKLK